MGHWIFLYIECRTLYFLDSFGLKPRSYSRYFDLFLNNHKHFKLWLQNRQLQSSASHICGAYSLFFFYVICNRGIIFLKKMLKNDFRNSSTMENDQRVLRRVYKEFGGMPHCADTFCLNRYTYRECIFYLCHGLG